MDFQAAATDQIALLNQGSPLEAFDRYFDDDGVMFDNDEPFASGKAECRAKQEAFITGASDIIGNITRWTLDEETSTCVFRNQSTYVDEAGKDVNVDGVHWQQWSDDKIIEERYYRGDMMTQKIAEGIFDRDAAVSEAPTAHVSAEATAMRNAILQALEALVKDEQVEIAKGATGLVADELMVAGLEGRNPRHALKKLRIALIDSDHVEEVYAADLFIEDAFRRAMGG